MGIAATCPAKAYNYQCQVRPSEGGRQLCEVEAVVWNALFGYKDMVRPLER